MLHLKIPNFEIPNLKFEKTYLQWMHKEPTMVMTINLIVTGVKMKHLLQSIVIEWYVVI